MTIKPMLIAVAFSALLIPYISYAQTTAKVEMITLSIFNKGAFVQDADSLQVYYSNNRGGAAVSPQGNYYGDYSSQPFLYDSLKSIAQNPLNNNYSTNLYTYHRVYDNNNNIIEQLSKSLTNQYRSKILYTYDVNNRLVSTVQQFFVNNAWVNKYKDSTTYNTTGKITATYNYTWWTNNVWKTNSHFAYNYINGLLDEIIRYQVNSQNVSTIVNRIKNHYNTSNVLDSSDNYSINNMFSGRDYYSYPSTNEIVKEKYTYNSSTQTLHKNRLEKYTYNTNNDIITEEHLLPIAQTNTWQAFGIKYLYSYNSISKNLETKVYQGHNNNAYINSQRVHHIHNSNGLYTHSVSEYWDQNNNVWENRNTEDSVFVYHYSQTSTTSTPTINTSNTTVNIFPNPSSSFITVRINWEKEESFVIAIYNTQGQLVRQFEDQTTKQYQRQIPLGGLPAGNYMLEIRSKGNRIVKQFNKAE